ncbi:hypothetical protein [Streptomyces sp. NPDC007988]|uniref:hypothetical protein n=1 Tax=Streptomyces sp. NPDC007988 TaxID=3364802 RepID=UPI0036E4F45D
MTTDILIVGVAVTVALTTAAAFGRCAARRDRGRVTDSWRPASARMTIAYYALVVPCFLAYLLGMDDLLAPLGWYTSDPAVRVIGSFALLAVFWGALELCGDTVRRPAPGGDPAADGLAAVPGNAPPTRVRGAAGFLRAERYPRRSGP